MARPARKVRQERLAPTARKDHRDPWDRSGRPVRRELRERRVLKDSWAIQDRKDLRGRRALLAACFPIRLSPVFFLALLPPTNWLLSWRSTFPNRGPT